MGLDILNNASCTSDETGGRYGERERSYLSLFGGRYGMGYTYRSGSLWTGLELRQQVDIISHFLRSSLNINCTCGVD